MRNKTIKKLARQIAALTQPVEAVEAEEISFEGQTFDDAKEVADAAGLDSFQFTALRSAGVLRNDQEVAIWDDAAEA